MPEKKEIKTQEDKNKLIIQSLFHTENEVVLEAIKQIKSSGNVELLYPLLQLIKRTSNPKIDRKARAVFFDLKSNDAVHFIVESLQQEKSTSIKQFLVSACWNNSLDYSANLAVFIDLFINENFEIAFDAFTVIENMTNFPDTKTTQEQIDNLKKSIKGIESSKKQLLSELIHLLEKQL